MVPKRVYNSLSDRVLSENIIKKFDSNTKAFGVGKLP